jgi:hypothetical protein
VHGRLFPDYMCRDIPLMRSMFVLSVSSSHIDMPIYLGDN